MLPRVQHMAEPKRIGSGTWMNLSVLGLTMCSTHIALGLAYD